LLEKFSRASSKKPITDRPKTSRKVFAENDLGDNTENVAHHLPTDACRTDPDLAAVVSAWPDLSEAIKAGILAMVKAASGRA
jgi:hypothetical protein